MYRQAEGNLIEDGSFAYNPNTTNYFITNYTYYTGTFMPEGRYGWVTSAYNIHNNGTSNNWGNYPAKEGARYLAFNGFSTNATVWRNANPIQVEYGRLYQFEAFVSKCFPSNAPNFKFEIWYVGEPIQTLTKAANLLTNATPVGVWKPIA